MQGRSVTDLRNKIHLIPTLSATQTDADKVGNSQHVKYTSRYHMLIYFYIFGYTYLYSLPFFSLYVCSQLEEFNYTSQPTR